MSMDQDRNDLLSVFLGEAEDILVALEDGLGRQQDPPGSSSPAPTSLVLLAHRLKGAAALHGFSELSGLAGAMEEILERARDAPGDQARRPEAVLAGLAAALRRHVDAIRTTGHEAVADEDPAPTQVIGRKTALVTPLSDALAYFLPEAAEHLDVVMGCLLALEQGHRTDEELATLFRAIHTLKGAAYVVGCTAVGDLAHRLEDVLAAVQTGRLPLSPVVLEGLHAAAAALRRLLATADRPPAELAGTVAGAAGRLSALAATSGAPTGVAPAPASPGSRPARRRAERLDGLMSLVGELVTARTRLDHHLRQVDRLGDQLTASGARMARALGDFDASARREAEPGSRAPAESGADDGARTIPDPPVASLFAELELDRYDDSDLLTRRAREIAADLSVVQSQLGGVRRLLTQDADEIQRLTGSLRTEIVRARLVPVRKLFARVARQIRELASAADKTVAVKLRDEAVEVDSILVERLADPILHLVRNAIVHGIESPDERRRLGKSPHGTVSLGAAHRGGSVYIEVRDDGRGIDPERVKEQAVRQGLLPREVAELLHGPEALDLIFLPGLSTAPLVTAEAGRGVGMDAVRASVGALNGEITVQTEPGVGTRFTMKLPLTVAGSDALLVRAGTETLAIPLSAIRRVRHEPRERIESAGPGARIRVDDQLLELIRLDRVLGLATSESTGPVPVVVLGAAGEPVALAVDELLGKEEIVIKGLGEFLEGIGSFGGATVSAEGRVILVLDAVRLREAARALVGATVLPPPAHEPAAYSPPAVLLVDDSISVRKFAGQILERAGFAVLTAADGAEALALLDETPVSLVITDLEMPRVNGFELVHELRRRPATRDLPIVVLTTRVGAKHLNLARWLGVTDYVAKPVDEPVFVRLIASLTGAGRPPRAASTSATDASA